MELVLISKCCVGIKCRYRCTGYLKQSMEELGKHVNFIAVCPEMLGGLPCPREGTDVKGRGVVGRRTGTSYTKQYRLGAEKTLALCKRNKIKTAYLLNHSPSCGKGYGVTARLLDKSGIVVIAI